MAGDGKIGPGLFSFLSELEENNNRTWFEANKARYESEVKGPLLGFIGEFGTRLQEISPHFVADARPSGGSLFRIYRDIRFSKDKTPYKTQAGMHFRHDVGREVHGPGFYLHLEPGEVFGGVGIWHPDSKTLGKVRDATVAKPKQWQKIVNDKQFTADYRLEGESLARPPKGYDPDHPLIDDLKRKDFVATRRLAESDALADDFVDRYVNLCRGAGPFAQFLTEAVGLPW